MSCKIQKVVNFVAIASGVVSLTVVGSGLYVYLQRDKLVDSVKSQVLKSVTGSLPGLVDTKIPSITGPALAPQAPAPGKAAGKAAGGATGFGIPGLPR
jgi:hypothetical protein